MNPQQAYIRDQLLQDSHLHHNSRTTFSSTIQTITTACSEICKIFCCPPCPNLILAKIILRPPDQTYDFLKNNDNSRSDILISSSIPDNSTSTADQSDISEITTVQPTTESSSTTCLVRKSSRASSKPSQKMETYSMKIDFDELIDPFPPLFNPETQITAFYVNSEIDSAKIPCIFIRSKPNEKQKYVLLYSHGNGVDIGEMAGTLAIYAHEFQVDVVCYDYRGYGLADGWAEEKYIHSDALSIFNFLKNQFSYKNEDIILYGQSIGSVPTSKLASLEDSKGIKGVILHSPLASAARFLKLEQKSHKLLVSCFNPYANVDCCENIDALTLVIHGTEDEVIDFEQAEEVYTKLKNPFPPIRSY